MLRRNTFLDARPILDTKTIINVHHCKAVKLKLCYISPKNAVISFLIDTFDCWNEKR